MNPHLCTSEQGLWISALMDKVEPVTGSDITEVRCLVLQKISGMLQECPRKSRLAAELRLQEEQIPLLIKLIDKISSTGCIPASKNTLIPQKIHAHLTS
jgi:hypothetical protein